MPDAQNLDEMINRAAETYLASRCYAALVIGIYQRGNHFIQGFGKFSGTNGRLPDAQTLFEIGSITKPFTAIALARMVEDGLMKLEDPLGLYLPQGIASPKTNGQEITLNDLATHTSGLPRLPENFYDVSKNRLNPYATYTTKDLFDSLATIKLKSEPGKKWEYSNYGYGLLGKILELRTGKSYEDLIQEYVCRPLGLLNTTTQPSSLQKERLTPGHSPKGQIVPNWDFDALPGCGAIRSNVEDLLKFIEANLGKCDPRISLALNKTQECLFKKDNGWMGLGWRIYEIGGRTFHFHNGGTGGYVSFLVFDKARQFGVVLLSNYGDALMRDFTLDKIGMALAAYVSKE